MTMSESLHVLEDHILAMTLLGDMHDRIHRQFEGMHVHDLQ